MHQPTKHELQTRITNFLDKKLSKYPDIEAKSADTRSFKDTFNKRRATIWQKNTLLPH